MSATGQRFTRAESLSPGAALLEREAELAAIQRRVEAAAGGEGSLLVIEGLAGTGKTALMKAATFQARAGGTLVLEASGSELERDLGFGVVRGLLERYLTRAGSRRSASLLSGAARLAEPVVKPAARRAPIQPAAAIHGLFWLVSNLAERGPLMLVVDDAHWADVPSLRFLGYLARRLGDLPVLLMIAIRPGEPGVPDDFLRGLIGSDVLSPRPLSQAAVSRLVAARYAAPPAPEFATACHVATGGNPFLISQLLASLASDAIAPTAANVPRIFAIGPQTVSMSVLARISRLGAEAVALAEALAVLGGGELRDAATLARLDPEAAAAAADGLGQIGVLRGSRPLEYVHPLVHAAVYEGIPPARRSLAHQLAARLLAQQGAAADRVALHLLNAEPSGQDWVVQTLRAAATAASLGGAPDQAAIHLRRALREPPPADARAELLRELGAAELLAREPTAVTHLTEALAESTDLDLRGQTALLLGRAAVSTGRLAEAREVLAPVIEELHRARPGIVARLEAYRWAAGLWDPRYTRDLERELPRLRSLAEEAGADGRSLLLLIAFRSTFEGRSHDEIMELVERGLDRGQLIEDESAEAIEITWAVRALTFIDELDRAEQLLDDMLADSRSRGSVMGYATAIAWRAAVALRRGQVGPAEADARAAVELLTQHGLHVIAPHTYSFLGEALIERGELDEAATLLDAADLGPMQGSRPEARFLHVRARVSLARGNSQAAIADLRATASQEPWFRNPNAMAWRSTLALALPPGDRALALELVDLELEQARRIGQPRAIGVALRARGLLCRGEEQMSLLRQACDALASSPSRLELARARGDLGAALRRAGRRTEAREQLTLALDVAAECGARAIAVRAREELLAAGARPRRERTSGVEALTASERRVANMAAAGMTNREIAQALFVTVKAVAMHLTHVYEKLQIDGRPELATALASQPRSNSLI